MSNKTLNSDAFSKTQTTAEDEIEAALIEADLFLKYQVSHRAIERLRETIERRPHAVKLRERLREIAATNQHADEAARQCLALANLYIAREDFDTAQDRLLEAKQHDARISIASGLEAIRRARRPTIHDSAPVPALDLIATPRPILAGDLAFVSVFDIVQVIENGKHTGVLNITDATTQHRLQVHFNDGVIVGASGAELDAVTAFQKAIETTAGAFEFERAEQPFPVSLKAASNTNLILDMLRLLDEEKNK